MAESAGEGVGGIGVGGVGNDVELAVLAANGGAAETDGAVGEVEAVDEIIGGVAEEAVVDGIAGEALGGGGDGEEVGDGDFVEEVERDGIGVGVGGVWGEEGLGRGGKEEEEEDGEKHFGALGGSGGLFWVFGWWSEFQKK